MSSRKSFNILTAITNRRGGTVVGVESVIVICGIIYRPDMTRKYKLAILISW